MLMQIDEFRRRVDDDMDTLVSELQFVTSRRTSAEEAAWRSSLPKVAKAFSAPSFSRLHMFFGEVGLGYLRDRCFTTVLEQLYQHHRLVDLRHTHVFADEFLKLVERAHEKLPRCFRRDNFLPSMDYPDAWCEHSSRSVSDISLCRVNSGNAT